jgi:O-antigen ligase
LLVCVAVYVATAVGRIHQLFPALLPLKPAFVAAALAIALYLLQQSGPRSLHRLRSPTTTWLLALLLWTTLSVPGALSQGIAFQVLTGFVKTIAMYVVLAGSVRSRRDIERLILVYFVVTAVYAAVVLSRFHLGADNWRLGRLYDYDANDFATLIATAMPLGLYFVLGQRRPLPWMLALAGLAVLAVGEISSGSRGGFLALFAVAAFVLVCFSTLHARSRLIGLVVIVVVVFAAASDRYWTQMHTILTPHRDYNVTAEEGRLAIWGRGLDYMTSHPVLGLGAGNFQMAEGTISPLARRQEYGQGVLWGAAHNSFIEIGAELGLPGLVLFVGVIASAFASLRRVARYGRRMGASALGVARLAQTLMAALVGFVVGGFFLSLAFSDMLYTLAALAVALEKVTLPRRAPI